MHSTFTIENMTINNSLWLSLKVRRVLQHKPSGNRGPTLHEPFRTWGARPRRWDRAGWLRWTCTRRSRVRSRSSPGSASKGALPRRSCGRRRPEGRKIYRTERTIATQTHAPREGGVTMWTLVTQELGNQLILSYFPCSCPKVYFFQYVLLFELVPRAKSKK